MAGYAELHCHSHYSFLDGVSSPRELVRSARKCGLAGLALTDHDGLYGAVPFWQAAREARLLAIIGAEVTMANGAHLVLLAENQEGYSHLCQMISAAQLAGQKGQPHLDHETLAAHTQGLIALSGCHRGEVPAALLRKDVEAARERAIWYREIFGPQGFWIELQRHWLQEDQMLVGELVALARSLGIPYVATNDVHCPWASPMWPPTTSTTPTRKVFVSTTSSWPSAITPRWMRWAKGSTPTPSTT